MVNLRNQEHSSDPKIRTMFLEMQNSFLGGRFWVFLPSKLTGFCQNFYKLFNHFFSDFEYHTREAEQIFAYLRKISYLVAHIAI